MLGSRPPSVASASGSHDDDKTSDHALFDGTNPLTEAPPSGGAECRVRGPGTFHVTVSAHSSGPGGFVRATFEDGDFVQFPIASGASFSFSQSIGGTKGVDRRIRISNGNDPSGAQLVGWVSVQGKRASCRSCNFDDGAGAPDCVNNP
jgi:hypothetical protein